jgi:hypothetical protein
MKRSPMPPRKTPLKRGSRLSPVGAKTRRERAALDAMRLTVHARSGGYCEVRTPACPPGRHEGTDCHHRWPSDRDKGDHLAERAVLLCRESHAWTHRTPTAARAAGLLMRDGDPDPWLQESA